MTDQWELGDLYKITLDWVAARQRDGVLKKFWTSIQSFNGDRLIAYRPENPDVGYGAIEPYIVIYDARQGTPRYEVHRWIHPRLGMVEITGKCDAADPTFFEKLLKDMTTIQSAI